MLSNVATPIEYSKFRSQVLSGEIPVCQEISMQMNRIDAKILNPEYFYDDEAIDGFVKFCESELTLTDGDDLELTECFKLWAEDLLAWFYFESIEVYNPKTRRKELHHKKKRLCNKQVIVDGRGSAKSMYASAIQAYMLVVDPRTTNQYVVAPTMKQSEETLDPVRTALVRARGPVFKFLTDHQFKRFSKARSTLPPLCSTKRGIQNTLNNSCIEIRPMRIDKLQGMRAACTTIDEWLSGEVKEDVLGAIEQGACKVDDYIIVLTSSEGTARHGVGDTFKMELNSILKGNYIADNVSIFHYKLDDISEVNDPAMWIKANSNIGITVSYDSYQKDVERMSANPAVRNDILAKRFGIPTSGLTYFFTYEETLRQGIRDYRGLPCALGADMSRGNDFCSYLCLFPFGHDTFGCDSISFISENTYAKLPNAQRELYSKFMQEKSLIVMPGVILDMEQVYEEVYNWLTENNYDPNCYGFDPYNSFDFNKRYIMDFGEYNVEKVIQGFRTESVPLQELKDLAGARRISFHQEIMEYAMGNAVAEVDNNYNIKLSKINVESKIDPVAALLDAFIAYKRHLEEFQ